MDGHPLAAETGDCTRERHSTLRCPIVPPGQREIAARRHIALGAGVDVYVGRYHVIGGFFERNLDTTTRPDPFRAICREIREETGIQSNDIQEQYCLGVVYDLTTPHGEICFLTRLKITLAEVYRRTPEENEIKQLQSLYVTQESLKDFLLANHSNISATGEPNLLMYGGWKFGEGWLEEVMEQW